MKNSPTSRFVAVPGVPVQIADHLQAQIVRGKLRPGERIAEARVTQTLNVSRGSVREAMQLLAARHLVDVEPRRGARVSLFGPADVRGLYDLQICLLKLLAGRVAQIYQSDDLPPLLAYRDALQRAADEADPAALLALSSAFQMAACDLAGNVYLRETMERMLPAFERAHFLALAAGPAERLGLAQFTAELVDAVIARDDDTIAAVVEDYGKRQCAAVLAGLEKQQAQHQAQT